MEWSAIAAKKYLKKHGILELLAEGSPDQLKPNYIDLARLHYFATKRKSFTILEFGVGWSTIVLAHALRLNEQAWLRQAQKRSFRVEHPFRIFSVDSSRKWITVAKKTIPQELKKYIVISYSELEPGTFNDRICHYYQKIPNIIPDFVYLDGPDCQDVPGSIHGMDWSNKERSVMAGDLLLMEPTLLPGTFILVDGRVNNVRFLKNNFQRNWKITHFPSGDVTTLELNESPLGRINKEKLSYCLKR